ncbi:hypothetical protein JCGZ_01590 [Jatropha curcas]|uniref:Ribosomal protein S7 n=1 Tax=Jatropha curcas TaxID=180498 RepID=A0A067L1D9_JATCU|nr:30S ribosomal protein S7, chloroplastic isoform X1 [Jatropha curcas]KDP42266.1 hypothetical protein JCGZ_01590 [Jatropha curcas]
MASSSTALCSPHPLSSPRAASHAFRHSTVLPFLSSFHFKKRSNLTVNHEPPPSPCKVLCSRNPRGKKKSAKSDPIYHNRLVNLFVNRILKNGKKSLAFYIMYRALKMIQMKTKSNPLIILRQATLKVTPDVAVKATRVGGSTYQVPIELGSLQARAIAIRWLLEAARERHGPDMAFKLCCELMEAAAGNGNAFRKKETTHKMAESNRAFVHFRQFM